MAFREVRVYEVRDNEAPRIMRRGGPQASCIAGVLLVDGWAPPEAVEDLVERPPGDPPTSFAMITPRWSTTKISGTPKTP